MQKKKILHFLILFFTSIFCLFSLGNSIAQAQSNQKPTRILFILDASGSMSGKWKSSTKMEMAKSILTHLADSLRQENIPYAVRVFGHQSEKKLVDCKDTKLELPLSINNTNNLKNLLNRIEPKGYSPIAVALEAAINDFPISKQEQRPVIILISDGFENCSGNACEAADKLQKAGIYLRPYIIGLGLTDEQKNQFDCVGQLVDVQENDLELQNSISEVVITQIMNPTSLQINLLNQNEKATESNVNMSFSNSRTGSTKYNFYHTLNNAGQADTLFIDPSIRYNVKVHTLPSKKIEQIDLPRGKHTIKAVEAPQGSLKLVMSGNTKAKSIRCIVRQDDRIINAQELNSTQKYLTGNYQLEILTIPKLTYESVEISQSQVKTINIPNPGILQINKAAGYVFIQRRNAQNKLETIYTFDSKASKESIQLLPGNYELIFRPKAGTSIKSTQIKKVSIVSGIASTISF